MSDSSHSHFRIGELFCGAGGIAAGIDIAAADLRSQGLEVSVDHAWANDFDKHAAETYRRNFPSARVIHKDVRDLDVREELDPIDGFAFGFPCNDFSLVGEQKGLNGDWGGLYEYGAHVIDEFSPSWFVAENVGGLRSSNDGQAFQIIMSRLQDAGNPKYGGYTLYPHLYKFEEYGLPQRRHRILIVGIRNDLPVEFRVPSPEPYKHIDNSVASALSGIPDNATHHEMPVHSPDVVERLKLIKPGQNAWTADLPPRLQINAQGAKISAIYRRLEGEKPSMTITAAGGGGSMGFHHVEPRALTNRERARIQTFPDDFNFSGGRSAVRKQIGMAVPPAGAAVVFSALFKSFSGMRYASVEPNLLGKIPARAARPA